MALGRRMNVYYLGSPYDSCLQGKPLTVNRALTLALTLNLALALTPNLTITITIMGQMAIALKSPLRVIFWVSVGYLA